MGETMTQEVIGQILGIVATVMTVLSYQTNTKRGLLTVQSVATLSMCLSYLLLDAASGFALNAVCLVRNGCFYFQKSGSRVNLCTAIALALVMAVLGVLSWQGWISILMIVALAINTVFMSFGDPQLLRKSILLTSTLVLIYNIAVFTVGGILNEALAIASAVVGIIRFRRGTDGEKQE